MIPKKHQPIQSFHSSDWQYLHIDASAQRLLRRRSPLDPEVQG